MSKRITELNVILRELEQNCDLNGSALVTDKGQMICSSLPEGTKEKAISAMAAAILSIGRRVGAELKIGTPRSTLIDGSEKSVILRGLGRMLLLGMAPFGSEIGLIDFELTKAAERLLAILGDQKEEEGQV